MQSYKEITVHACMRQGVSLYDYSAKRATEKKHEVRIRGWHCAVKYKKLKFPIDFLKAISYDMPNK